MKRIEHMVESIILASRWLLVIFYVGLAVALLVYAASFGLKLFAFICMSAESSSTRRWWQASSSW